MVYFVICSLRNSDKKIKVAFGMGRREMTKRDVIGRRKPSEACFPSGCTTKTLAKEKKKKNLHTINPKCQNNVHASFNNAADRSQAEKCRGSCTLMCTVWWLKRPQMFLAKGIWRAENKRKGNRLKGSRNGVGTQPVSSERRKKKDGLFRDADGRLLIYVAPSNLETVTRDE